MNTRSRGLETGDQPMGKVLDNPGASTQSLDASHDARKYTGATTKGAKSKLVPSDPAPQTDTNRKVTPEKLTKWVVDAANAVVGKIPAINTKETPMGSVGTTERVTTLAGVPWSSKRIGDDSVLDSPGDSR